jgi:hypothetical protein
VQKKRKKMFSSETKRVADSETKIMQKAVVKLDNNFKNICRYNILLSG